MKEILNEEQFLNYFFYPVILFQDINQKCEEYKEKNIELRYLKRFRYHFLFFYKLILDHLSKQGKINLKKLMKNKEVLYKFTNPAFEKISDNIIDLYVDETNKDAYKNAPIRDLTISKDHLETLKKKISNKLVNFNIDI